MRNCMNYILVTTISLAACWGSPINAKQVETQTLPTELLATIAIPGTELDKSGLTNELSQECTNNMLGGFSALAYSGSEDIYFALPDRGPKDGAVDWSCRIQKFRLKVSVSGESSYELLETILLHDQFGQPLTGLASAFPKQRTSNGSAQTAQAPSRFDPEGIRIGASGNFFVSDEYGPRLIEFSRQGKWVRELALPSKFVVAHPGLSKAEENLANDVGRQSNRGMEGLAISADHQTLFGLLQSPLIQDCEKIQTTVVVKPAEHNPTEAGKFTVNQVAATQITKTTLVGLNVRLLQLSVSGRPQKEMLYQLDARSNKLNEILAIDRHTFVVIERDGESGDEAKFKKLMLVSTQQATDIAAMESLPAETIPASVTPISKHVLIDLLDPRWKLAGAKMPEKIEGLAFGPLLADGRKTLWVMSDNDFEAGNPSLIYVFAMGTQ
ncbi:MAG: hypothetical protein ACI87E_001885 [Mariniblastus sp.]|jgi:hypothetical protein